MAPSSKTAVRSGSAAEAATRAAGASAWPRCSQQGHSPTGLASALPSTAVSRVGAEFRQPFQASERPEFRRRVQDAARQEKMPPILLDRAALPGSAYRIAISYHGPLIACRRRSWRPGAGSLWLAPVSLHTCSPPAKRRPSLTKGRGPDEACNSDSRVRHFAARRLGRRQGRDSSRSIPPGPYKPKPPLSPASTWSEPTTLPAA
jgi:hypothetical protein